MRMSIVDFDDTLQSENSLNRMQNVVKVMSSDTSKAQTPIALLDF